MARPDPGFGMMALEIGGAIGAALVGIATIAAMRRQARGSVQDRPVSLMEEFRRAYEAGEMDEEEFRRVRDSLTRRKAGRGGPAAGPAAAPPIVGDVAPPDAVKASPGDASPSS